MNQPIQWFSWISYASGIEWKIYFWKSINGIYMIENIFKIIKKLTDGTLKSPELKLVCPGFDLNCNWKKLLMTKATRDSENENSHECIISSALSCIQQQVIIEYDKSYSHLNPHQHQLQTLGSAVPLKNPWYVDFVNFFLSPSDL